MTSFEPTDEGEFSTNTSVIVGVFAIITAMVLSPQAVDLPTTMIHGLCLACAFVGVAAIISSVMV